MPKKSPWSQSQAPIPLIRKEEEKVSADKLLKFKLKNNPSESNSPEFEFSIRYFKEGDVETFLTWRTNLETVLRGMNANTASKMFSLTKQMLRGDALAAYNQAEATYAPTE